MKTMVERQTTGVCLAFFVIATSVISQSNAAADANDGLRTTDYFISHESNDPFYGRHGIDPNVLLHVREVVMSGRERTVREDGKVLVLIHGGTFPGTVAYDTDISNVSLMRHFASLGWDTFALDLEGFGSSTRPMSMEVPEAFPDEPAPGRMEVTLANVSRVVDFVRDLRGVDRVHLLGWSMGATLEAPRYAIQYPDKVAKLVLYGANYQGWGRSEEETSKRVNAYNKEKVRFGYPASIERWGRLGTKAEFVDPIVFEAYRIAHLASDPKSGELGGAIRAPRGRNVDLELEEPHFDASKITVPTLVIRGEHDTFAKQEDNQALMDMLGGDQNEFVVIPDAGHFLHFERTNMQFYAALRDFLEK